MEVQLTRKSFININITNATYQNILAHIVVLAQNKISSYVCTLNVHMVIEAYKDKVFANAVNNANLITIDGMPIVKAIQWLYGTKLERVAGMDLLPDLVSESEKHKLSIFFYGATTTVLNKINNKINLHFPNVRANFYSPPFRELSEKEEKEVVDLINKSGANMVFVALGCPKQEKWMNKMQGKINAVMIGLGGAFPVYAEIEKRAPRWMQKNGMEWFFRLVQDPKRLWKRYLTTNFYFVYLILKYKLIKKFETSQL